MTGAEFKATAAQTIKSCKKYGFMERTIMPYGFRMTVAELSRNWADYDICTRDSQSIMRDELAGFLPILAHWIEYENEPMMAVKLIAGPNKDQIKEYHKSTAEMLIDGQMAIAI